jgi:hypothetical protein
VPFRCGRRAGAPPIRPGVTILHLAGLTFRSIAVRTRPGVALGNGGASRPHRTVAPLVRRLFGSA